LDGLFEGLTIVLIPLFNEDLADSFAFTGSLGLTGDFFSA
jgi:hypothetical protein